MTAITFAHRGACREEAENTLPAFARGLALGASGLESDVWLSGDGIPVLVHDGTFRRGLHRIRVAEQPAAALSELGIPSLAELYATCGTDYELSLDVKDRAAVPAVLAVAGEAGALARLWLCHPDTELLTETRSASEVVRLVHSDRRERVGPGFERHAHTLATGGIDAVNFHHLEWSKGLVTLYHRFDVRAFAWDVQEIRHQRAILAMGIDALYSDYVARLVEVAADFSALPTQTGTDSSAPDR